MEHFQYLGIAYEVRWSKPSSRNGAIFSITPHGVPFDPAVVRAAADRVTEQNADYIARVYRA